MDWYCGRPSFINRVSAVVGSERPDNAFAAEIASAGETRALAASIFSTVPPSTVLGSAYINPLSAQAKTGIETKTPRIKCD